MNTHAKSAGSFGKTLWEQERRSITYLAIALAYVFLMVIRALVPGLRQYVTADFPARMLMNLQALCDLLFLAGAIYGVWRAFHGLVPKFGEHFLLDGYQVDFGGGRKESFRTESEAKEAASSDIDATVEYVPPQWSLYMACVVLRCGIGAMCWPAFELLMQGSHLWKTSSRGATDGETPNWENQPAFPVIAVGVVAWLAGAWLLSIPGSAAQTALKPKLDPAELTLYSSIMQAGKTYDGQFVDQEPHERVRLTLLEVADPRYRGGTERWNLRAELKSLDHPDRARIYDVAVDPRHQHRLRFGAGYNPRPGQPKATGHDLAFSPHDYCDQTGRVTNDGVIELYEPQSNAPWLRFTTEKSSL